MGIVAGSLALIGFGADLMIEVFASSVVVWHIRPGHATEEAARTTRALRLAGAAFIALAIVLAVVRSATSSSAGERRASPGSCTS